jgi:hypothetical protein
MVKMKCHNCNNDHALGFVDACPVCGVGPRNFPERQDFKKEKPMLSKEEKVCLLNYLYNSVRVMNLYGNLEAFGGEKEYLIGLVNLGGELLDSLLHKFIADDGVGNE